MSGEIAEVIKNTFPLILQNIDFFFSSDIEKGNNWNTDVAKAMAECDFGIFVLTPENINEPWINFEAGAISLKLENTKTATFAFGLKSLDIKFPLAQFQSTFFEKEGDVFKLFETINNCIVNCNEKRLKDDVLKKVFETYCGEFEKNINIILEKYKSESPQTELSYDEVLLNDIYDLLKKLYNQTNKPKTWGELLIEDKTTTGITKKRDDMIKVNKSTHQPNIITSDKTSQATKWKI